VTIMKNDVEVHHSALGTAVNRNWKIPLLVLAQTVIILGIGAGYGLLRFGSFPAALSAIRGDAILVDQPFKSMNGIRAGSRVVLHYALTNASDRPIQLVGVKCSCRCTKADELPFTIGVSETRSLSATVRTREDESASNGVIRLYTDHPESAEITLGYSLHLTRPTQPWRTETDRHYSK
jgi:hypothetical protein